MNSTVIAFSLVAAALALFRLARRGGTSNILLCVAAFFTLFAYGPVINLLLGAEVYAGIHLAKVEAATIGFALALVGMVVADALLPQRTRYDASAVTGGTRTYLLLPVLYVILIAYAGSVVLLRYSALVSVSKLAQIAAAGPGHHIFLLIQVGAVSLYFLSRRTVLLRRLWMTNLVVYVGYCLLTSERDFLLVVFSVLVHREMMANAKRTIRLAGAGAVAFLVGTLLFVSRAQERFDVTAIFNQGSILFVDTFLLRFVPSVLPHRQGGTYVDTVVGVLPSWLVDTSWQSLSTWLVTLYAPGGTSGYGFSLTGEAYLNFGLAGIPVVFFLMTLAHRYVVNRADVSDWWAYFSVYSTAIWMYALRGDSSQLVKSLVYGATLFGLLRVVSVRYRPPREEQRARRSPAVLARTGPATR